MTKPLYTIYDKVAELAAMPFMVESPKQAEAVFMRTFKEEERDQYDLRIVGWFDTSTGLIVDKQS